MKKIIALLLILFFTLPASSNLFNAEQEFVLSYAENRFSESAYLKLKEINQERASVLKKQAEAVEIFFSEVLKTEKQLVPKQCNYLVIFGYNNSSSENLKKGCDNLRLAAFANMDRTSMKIFLAGSKENIKVFQDTLSKTPMPKDRVFEVICKNSREAASKTVSLILDDVNKNNYEKSNILYRRIMILTNASNTRCGFASFISALGNNFENMILDTFSSLDITRKKLDKISLAERKAAFLELTGGNGKNTADDQG